MADQHHPERSPQPSSQQKDDEDGVSGRPPEGRGHVSPALLRDWREIPSEVLERQELRLLLQQAITDLPLIYRETFLLRDVEELSVDESAEVLGITVASVTVRLHRARIMLQKKLVPQLKRDNPKRRWFPWL
jgi:RNA polymerase sigma-70 factor (ECF subfamily)